MEITSPDQLKKETAEGAEFFILLNYNLWNSKRIEWDGQQKRFFALKFIGDTDGDNVQLSFSAHRPRCTYQRQGRDPPYRPTGRLSCLYQQYNDMPPIV